MPNYEYYCLACDVQSERIMIPVERRNEQYCHDCGNQLTLMISKPGLVWAPTRKSGL